MDLDIPPEAILEALEAYSGSGRRFELKKKISDIMIIEDYAHHPTEVKATLEAAKRGWKRRTIAVFQPHRYSRLSVLMNSFATSFNQAPIAGVSGKVLHEEIVQFGHKNVYFEPDMKKIASLVGKMAQPEDMILILGAGNIYEVIPDIIKTLESKG